MKRTIIAAAVAASALNARGVSQELEEQHSALKAEIAEAQAQLKAGKTPEQAAQFDDASGGAIARAIVSVVPPGEAPTMSLIGRDG